MINNFDVNYIHSLLDQSNIFFDAYKDAGVHSLVVRRYREETHFDYIHYLCAGVCSQLKAGKPLSEAHLGGLLAFEDFDFITDEIYQEFFSEVESIHVGYFLASLLASQTLFNIMRNEVRRRKTIV